MEVAHCLKNSEISEVGWQRAPDICVVEKEKRDESIPTFLVNVMLDKQVGENEH